MVDHLALLENQGQQCKSAVFESCRDCYGLQTVANNFLASGISLCAISYICFRSPSWQPGVTTDEIDKAAHEAIIDSGAYPSLLGFGGFPKSVSTSINECICNGIPNSRVLKVRFRCQYVLASVDALK